MSRFQKNSLLLLLINIHLFYTQCLVIDGDEIRDLQHKGTTFQGDAENWSLTNVLSTAEPPYVTECGDFALIGGYGVLESDGSISRTYTSLPSHDIVYLDLQLFVIDDWSISDEIQLNIDGLNKPFLSSIGDQSDWSQGFCGSTSYKDMGIITARAKFFHTDSSMNIEFKSNLKHDSTRTSWGIRELTLSFNTKQVSEVEEACGYSETYTLESDNCECPNGEYESSGCTTCSQECKNCYGGTEHDCLSCDDFFVFSAGECVQNCADYAYIYNGTCLQSCDAPFEAGTYKGMTSCEFPCGEDEYLYDDGSCVQQCELPLVAIDEGGYRYCQFPCEEGEYAHWDGSCSQDCEDPFVSESGENEDKQCLHPCPDSSWYYYPENDGMCNSDCEYPYIVNQTESGLNECILNITQSDRQRYVTMESFQNVTMDIAIVKMLQHIKYMKINYPARILFMLQNHERNPYTVNFGPKIPASLKEEFKRGQLPENFARYNEPTNFIVNFWRQIMTLAILLSLSLLFKILELLGKKFQKDNFSYVFRRLKVLLKWNLFVLIFCSNYDSIVLSCTFQFRTVDFDDNLSIGGTVVASIVCLGAIALLVFTFFLIRSDRKLRAADLLSKSKHTKTKINEFVKKWEGFHILFMGFKDYSPFTHGFLCIFVGRIAFIMMVFQFLYEYPLVQTSILTGLSAGMIIFLLIMKPFKRLVNQFQLVTYELISLAYNGCVLALAVLDHVGSEDDVVRDTLGDTLMFISFSFYIAAFFYIGLKLVLAFIKALKMSTDKKNPNHHAWLQIILIPFQQGGMGFEEVAVDGDYESYGESTFGLQRNQLKKTSQVAPQVIGHKNNAMTEHFAINGVAPDKFMKGMDEDADLRFVQQHPSDPMSMQNRDFDDNGNDSPGDRVCSILSPHSAAKLLKQTSFASQSSANNNSSSSNEGTPKRASVTSLLRQMSSIKPKSKFAVDNRRKSVNMKLMDGQKQVESSYVSTLKSFLQPDLDTSSKNTSAAKSTTFLSPSPSKVEQSNDESKSFSFTTPLRKSNLKISSNNKSSENKASGLKFEKKMSDTTSNKKRKSDTKAKTLQKLKKIVNPSIFFDNMLDVEGGQSDEDEDDVKLPTILSHGDGSNQNLENQDEDGSDEIVKTKPGDTSIEKKRKGSEEQKLMVTTEGNEDTGTLNLDVSQVERIHSPKINTLDLELAAQGMYSPGRSPTHGGTGGRSPTNNVKSPTNGSMSRLLRKKSGGLSIPSLQFEMAKNSLSSQTYEEGLANVGNRFLKKSSILKTNSPSLYGQDIQEKKEEEEDEDHQETDPQSQPLKTLAKIKSQENNLSGNLSIGESGTIGNANPFKRRSILNNQVTFTDQDELIYLPDLDNKQDSERENQ